MTLRERFAKAISDARSLNDAVYKQASAEGRGLTHVERKTLDDAVALARSLADEVKSGNALDQLTKGMHITGGQVGAHSFDDGGDMKTLGEQFIESDGYKAAHAAGFKGRAWSTGAVELKTTLVSQDTGSGEALVQPEVKPGIVPLPLRRVRITDLLPSGTTGSNTVRLLVEKTFTSAAAPVLEVGTKQESALVFDEMDEPVRKIAHWIPVADEMLADSDAIRSFIDARLATGVLMTEEDQIVNGVGTPPNLSGILDREGLATAVVAAPTQTNADAILEQITAIESSQAFTVDGVIINPANWAAIIGSKDLEDRYYGAGPLGGSRDGDWIWGRRVVTSAAIEAGTAIVGAFQQACQILRNGGVTVEASNSHSDFFVHNMTAIRAESRLALAVYQPLGVGLVTGLTPPAAPNGG